MRIALERRPPVTATGEGDVPLPPSPPAPATPGSAGCAAPAQELMEIVTPRTNAAAVSPAENLFAAISLPEPFSLEIAATRDARWFLVRASSAAMRGHLEDQLGAAYPQAEVRRLDPALIPGLDPARRAPDEQVAACAFGLRGPEYLPLRTFSDLDLAADRAAHAAQADPMLGILGAMGDLPAGWRSLSQLVLRPAADDWCREYLRLAVESPLAAERGGETSLLPVFLVTGLLGTGAAALQAYLWYEAGEWLRLGALGAGASGGAAALIALARRLSRKDVYDRRLVAEKIGRIAYETHLRVAVFAPATVPRATVKRHLAQLAAAYRQFNLATGNGLRPYPLRIDEPAERRGRDLRALVALSSGGRFGRAQAPVLNTRELAGLWHLPQARADVPLLERTTSRRRLPLPSEVRRGCRIGTSTQLGRAVPVALPPDLLGRHMLLVAKTRRGKSSLLVQLARHAMAQRAPGDPGDPGELGEFGESARALVLVDPHRDLARAVLGLVPPARRDRVVYLDLAERRRPFGINLIDTGLGWGRDKAVANALALFRREFDNFWGPRMEDAFRFALLTLYEANEAICAADPGSGRTHQYTVLQVPPLLSIRSFREKVVAHTRDPMIRAWWTGYFDQLGLRLQVEIINPVLTKVSRFTGSYAGRAVVGQPRSTLDPASWLRDGAVVIVNTAKGVVGEDVAALVGGCIINLVGLVVGEQAALPPGQRRPVSVVVDEFHTMPGADYESMLSELAKYGCNLVLATQSLTKLEALDREQQRALRATVFANLDGLFAFHTSAEDALYLINELGGDLEVPDLVELGEHRCYVKISARGERLPVFSVSLDPPPEGDSTLADQLAAGSAARYGRDAAGIEAHLKAMLERIKLIRQQDDASRGSKEQHSGSDRGAKGTRGTTSRPGRNEHRTERKQNDSANHGPPHGAGGAAAAGAGPVASDAVMSAPQEIAPDPSDPPDPPGMPREPDGSGDPDRPSHLYHQGTLFDHTENASGGDSGDSLDSRESSDSGADDDGAAALMADEAARHELDGSGEVVL